MTSALNRKFDLLCRSGTCPAYLTDVLSLLVAHANDTELFKTELRATDALTHSQPAAAVMTTTPSHTQASAEQDAVARRLALIRKQAEDPEELDAAIRASHETVLLAAEHSLRTYAENLKHANDIALAAAEKQLRALRVETRAELERFQKLALESTVEQTRSELDLLRADWLTDTRGEVGQLRASVHKVGLEAQAEVHELTSAYTEFVVNTQTAISQIPLTEAHRDAGATLLMEEQMNTMLHAMADKQTVSALDERVKTLEKASARRATERRSNEISSLSHASPPPHRPEGSAFLSSTLPNDAPSAVDESLAAEHVPAASRPGTAALSRQPSSSGSEASPDTHPAHDRIGLSVHKSRNGICVVGVAPDSQALQKGIAIGSIISHVGRTHVTTTETYTQAVEAAAAVEGGSIKLTIYDPQMARVRVVAF